MRRILIISPCPGEGAGAEIVLEELLRAWQVATFQLVVLAPVGSRIQRIASGNGFEWHDLPVKKDGLNMRDNLRAVKAVFAAVPECDRVHAWTIRVFSSAEWLGRKWGVPVSGTLHDNPFPRKIHGPVLWDLHGMKFLSLRDWREMIWCTQELVLRTWWRWQWAHRAANRFSQLVCVSEAVRQECVKKGYRCPLTVIRNGLADMPVPERAPSDKVRIGFLGMSRPASKGFSMVQQWISQLQGDVEWKLYGNASKRTLKRIEHFLPPASLEKVRGKQRPEVRGQTSDCHTAEGRGWCYCASNEAARSGKKHEEAQKEAPATSNRHPATKTKIFPFVDYRGQQDRETIFSEIDILVHPSTTFDSLPTALIEAARAGTSCIASSNGGAGAIVEDGASGFVFDPAYPADGLENLKKLLKPDLRQKMGSSARKIFEERFAVERMVRDYKEVLQEGGN
jgi:glycosyltransferase involved in cell wall biosynthesis